MGEYRNEHWEIHFTYKWGDNKGLRDSRVFSNMEQVQDWLDQLGSDMEVNEILRYREVIDKIALGSFKIKSENSPNFT